jgi:LemA protein
MSSVLILLLVILVLFGVGIVLIYNVLVQKRALVENGWSDIEVQLKRRADLIPHLVDTVKGYAAHERSLFRDVIEARNAALAAGNDVSRRGGEEYKLATQTPRLLALKEDYPDLKSNENFLALQEELTETEDKIEMARRFYNGAVREMNIKVKSVPSNFVAGPFGFRAQPFFEIQPADRIAPNVSFD